MNKFELTFYNLPILFSIMKRRLVMTLFLLMTIFACNNLPTANSNLAFIAYISRLTSSISTTSITGSTAIPKIISTDFISNSTLAPVVISKTQTLSVTFDTKMSTTGCNIKVNGTVISGTTAASTDKLTLSFKPNTSWGIDVLTGLNLDLSSDCKSEGGISYVPGNGINVYIADSLIYVDSVAGNDSNAGTMSSPIKTLPTAITSISSTCTGTLACAIAIKGGNYSIASSIAIPTNLSIFGGFDPSDWTKRRADKTSLAPYDTIITDTSTGVTGTGPDPYSSIKFSNYAGTKEKSILDGIIVNGPVSANAGAYVSPIGIVNLQSGAGVTIRNTVTNDLSSTLSVTSVGFVSANSAGTINLTNSKFNASLVTGGSSSTHAIVYNGSTSTSAISISNCDIDAGISTTNSMGFNMTNTNNGIIEITKNKIIVRDCSSCDSIGVNANFATANGMTISENTISTGTGINSFGINFSNGTGLTVSKNTITTNTGSNSSKGITTGASAANMNISDNIISVGAGGSAGSVGIIIFNSTGNHTISGNTITSGLCNTASCLSAGIQETATASTSTVSNNIITGGSCTGVTCNSAGIYLAVSGAHTFTGNTITSGVCNTTSCITTGIFDNSQATLTFSNNTISSGTCNAIACDTRGYYLSHTFNTLSSTVSFSNNTITSGNCTGTTCKAFGFSTTNSMGASITYNFTGNTITSGDATLQSAGVNVAFNNATLTITSNTISSGSAPTTWGINNAFSAGTTYTNNTISVGSCTGACPQIGLRHAANSGITMTGNMINSGVAGASSTSRTALSLENWSGGASSVQRNTFLNQSGVGTPTAVDIPTANSNQLKFCSNVLIGGGRTNAGNAITLRMAQMNAGAGTKFNGNTIIGASVTSGTIFPVNFITNIAYTNFSLDQNIIAGNPVSSASTTCIKESGAVTYATLALNNLSDCSTLYDENGIIRNSFCAGGNFGNGCGSPLANPTGLNNTILSPTFVNFAGNDFHLDPATPVGITQGMTSGDLSVFSTACGNSLDRDGNTRVANSSIGAYK